MDFPRSPFFYLPFCFLLHLLKIQRASVASVSGCNKITISVIRFNKISRALRVGALFPSPFSLPAFILFKPLTSHLSPLYQLLVIS